MPYKEIWIYFALKIQLKFLFFLTGSYYDMRITERFYGSYFCLLVSIIMSQLYAHMYIYFYRGMIFSKDAELDPELVFRII